MIRQEISRAAAVADKICEILSKTNRLCVLEKDIHPRDFFQSLFRDMVESILYGKGRFQTANLISLYLPEIDPFCSIVPRVRTILQIYYTSELQKIANGIKVEEYPLLKERTVDEYTECRFLVGSLPNAYTIYTYFNYKRVAFTTSETNHLRIQKTVRKEWLDTDEKEIWATRAKKIRDNMRKT